MNFEREARRRGLGIHRRRGSVFSRHSWAYVKDDLESVTIEVRALNSEVLFECLYTMGFPDHHGQCDYQRYGVTPPRSVQEEARLWVEALLWSALSRDDLDMFEFVKEVTVEEGRLRKLAEDGGYIITESECESLWVYCEYKSEAAERRGLDTFGLRGVKNPSSIFVHIGNKPGDMTYISTRPPLLSVHLSNPVEGVRFEMPLSMWKGDVTQFGKLVSVLMRHTCELLETRRGVVDFGEEMTAYVEEWFEAYTVC